MRPIDLAGFERKFETDPDPWATWSHPDEALKRGAILHALGGGPLGRVLELGAGNGSNSKPLARRSLRLDATEATSAGTNLVERALAGRGLRARALRLVVPERLPRDRYDVVVIAELLYYLEPRVMAELARQIGGNLRRGGLLVLAHHRITFYDFVQRAGLIQERFLAQTGIEWQVRCVRRTRHWIVLACCPIGEFARKVS